MSPLLTGHPFGISAGIGKATYSATTGSPTIDTSSRPGKTIIKFTTVGTGSVTISTGGTFEVLVVGGGGAGGDGLNTTAAGGGGAGGYVYNASYYLPAGTYTTTVGAGSVGIGSSGTSTNAIAANNGNPSAFGSLVALGGAGGIPYTSAGIGQIAEPGASSGGSLNSQTPAVALLSQGNIGGTNAGTTAGSGGGGSGGTGFAGSGTTGGNGGIGTSNSITGTSLFYAAGGGGSGTVTAGNGGSSIGGNGSTASGATAGATNTGSGGGANVTSGAAGGSGGSGIVIVVFG